MSKSKVALNTGVDCTIAELAQIVKEFTSFTGELKFDATKSDGTARKLMDVSRLKSLGWESTVSLHEGFKSTYQWYLENIGKKQYENSSPKAFNL